jgi:F0F1-type ATP synthase membrane subunit a
MAVIFVVIALLNIAIRTSWLPRLRSFGLDIVARIFDYITSLLGTAKMARRYMWLLGGLVIIIFTGNIFGLILDWFVLISAHNWLATYFRPMYSDLSTTLVFSLTVIIVAQLTAIIMK